MYGKLLIGRKRNSVLFGGRIKLHSSRCPGNIAIGLYRMIVYYNGDVEFFFGEE